MVFGDGLCECGCGGGVGCGGGWEREISESVSVVTRVWVWYRLRGDLVILVILVILVVEEEERGAVNRKNGMSPGILRDILTNDLTHHRILAHENLGSSTKSLTCFLELGRTDVVDLDDEGFGVGGEKGLPTFEVFGFTFGGESDMNARES